MVLGLCSKAILKAYLQLSEIDYFFLTMDDHNKDGQGDAPATPEATPEAAPAPEAAPQEGGDEKTSM